MLWEAVLRIITITGYLKTKKAGGNYMANQQDKIQQKIQRDSKRKWVIALFNVWIKRLQKTIIFKNYNLILFGYDFNWHN